MFGLRRKNVAANWFYYNACANRYHSSKHETSYETIIYGWNENSNNNIPQLDTSSSGILDICNFKPLWHRNVVNWMHVAIHSKNRSTHSNSVCRSFEQNAACIVHLFWSQCVVTTTFRQKAKINHSIFTFFIQVQTYYAPTSFKLHNLGPTFR